MAAVFVGRSVFDAGEFRAALRWMRRLDRVGLSHVSAHYRLPAIEYLGLTRIALAGQLVLRDQRQWRVLARANGMICAFINAGRYSEALEVGEALRTTTDRLIRSPSRSEVELIDVNLSEALYNLGNWDAALKKLDGVDRGADATTLAGSRNQRCWIFAHTGRASEASKIHATINRSGLPRIFYAEHHFTRAVILMAMGQLDDAALELEVARSVVKRASSERNLLFLLGRLAMARSNVAEAEMLYRRGSRHRYKGQGGEGLLAWGDCLMKLDRSVEAHEAWQLSVERDPQSASAQLARSRLGNISGVATGPTRG
jgi:tetratricopeptide (TPR) repeat protein